MGHFNITKVRVSYDATQPAAGQRDAAGYALTDAYTRSKVNLSNEQKLVFLRSDTDTFVYVAPRKGAESPNIGSGGFGTCHVGQWLRGAEAEPQNVCIKVSDGKRPARRGREAMSRATLQEAAQTGYETAQMFDPSLMIALLESENAFYSVMKLAQGSVDHYRCELDRFDEKNYARIEHRAASMIFGVSTALIPMHQRGYAHDDVKMENMLIDEGQVRLCDYDLAHKMPHPRCLTKANRLYDAPERWLSQDAQNGLQLQPSDAESVKSDVYSMGVAVCFLAGISFYSVWETNRNNAKLFFDGYERIRHSPQTYVLDDAPPHHYDNFRYLQIGWRYVDTKLPRLAPYIYRMLALYPAERPSMAELRTAMLDTFPQGFDGLWQTPASIREKQQRSLAILRCSETVEIVKALRHITQPHRLAPTRAVVIAPTDPLSATVEVVVRAPTPAANHVERWQGFFKTLSPILLVAATTGIGVTASGIALSLYLGPAMPAPALFWASLALGPLVGMGIGFGFRRWYRDSTPSDAANDRHGDP